MAFCPLFQVLPGGQGRVPSSHIDANIAELPSCRAAGPYPLGRRVQKPSRTGDGH